MGELIDGIDPEWSYEELQKHGRITLKTTTYGRDFPQVSFRNKIENIVYWIDFEYDLSKIRHIEKSDEFGRRYTLYQRHGFLAWLK